MTEKLDKAIGKSFTLISDKVSRVEEKIVKNSAQQESALQEVKNELFGSISALAQELALKISSIPTTHPEYPKMMDYSKELEQIASSIEGLELPTMQAVEGQLKDIKVMASKSLSDILTRLKEMSSDSDIAFPDFEFQEIAGKKYLRVYVDRTGAGVNTVHVSNRSGSPINPATEETQANILTSSELIRLQTEQLNTIKLLVSLIQRPLYTSPSSGRLNVDNITTLSSSTLSTYTPPSGNTSVNVWLGQGMDIMRSSWGTNVRSKIS